MASNKSNHFHVKEMEDWTGRALTPHSGNEPINPIYLFSPEIPNLIWCLGGGELKNPNLFMPCSMSIRGARSEAALLRNGVWRDEFYAGDTRAEGKAEPSPEGCCSSPGTWPASLSAEMTVIS